MSSLTELRDKVNSAVAMHQEGMNVLKTVMTELEAEAARVPTLEDIKALLDRMAPKA